LIKLLGCPGVILQAIAVINPDGRICEPQLFIALFNRLIAAGASVLVSLLVFPCW
jgi:hypothetical protein